MIIVVLVVAVSVCAVYNLHLAIKESHEDDET